MTGSTSDTSIPAAAPVGDTTTCDPGSRTGTVLAALAAQQRRVLGIVADLDDVQLRRAVLPSGWSCAGMLRHLGLTSAFWCLNVIAGSPCDMAERDDFTVPGGAAADVVSEAAAQMADAHEIVTPLRLSDPVRWWPEGHWGGWRLTTVHEVLLHLLVETACHAGHLDVARELMDGRTWDYARGELTPA